MIYAASPSASELVVSCADGFVVVSGAGSVVVTTGAVVVTGACVVSAAAAVVSTAFAVVTAFLVVVVLAAFVAESVFVDFFEVVLSDSGIGSP